MPSSVSESRQLVEVHTKFIPINYVALSDRPQHPERCNVEQVVKSGYAATGRISRIEPGGENERAV